MPAPDMPSLQEWLSFELWSQPSEGEWAQLMVLTASSDKLCASAHTPTMCSENTQSAVEREHVSPTLHLGLAPLATWE